MSAAAQDALQALLASIKNLTVTKYCSVSAMTILLWDIMVTFDDEIKRVWYTRKSIGKYLFLFNRYIAPILFTFDLYCGSIFCKHAFLPPNILGIITLGTVQFILVLRTHALCQNFYLLGLLTFLCISAIVTMIATTVYLFRNLIVFEPDQIPEIVGCLPQCTEPLCRRLLTAFWVPFFVCETLSGLKYRSKLTIVVFRDAISLANLVVWIAAPISLSYVATSLMRCLQVTVCSRLLLNIRGMLDPDYGSMSMSSVAFKARSRVIEEATQNESYQLSERHRSMNVDTSGSEPWA
ncbi:hypothetical protein F5146DRAFT_1058010 [Armillaria mellea]|nr:hypothetical protein F5146DRAFT_1058010 [Armillaria mellea]